MNLVDGKVSLVYLEAEMLRTSCKQTKQYSDIPLHGWGFRIDRRCIRQIMLNKIIPAQKSTPTLMTARL